jgi:hypothetical protein
VADEDRRRAAAQRRPVVGRDRRRRTRRARRRPWAIASVKASRSRRRRGGAAARGASVAGIAVRALRPARLVEREARVAREHLARVAVAEVADEVALDLGAGEEGGVELGVVEAAHRSAIEADRARGDDEVAALQARVAKRGRLGKLLLADEPRPRVGVREEERQLVVEGYVHADDRCHRRGAGLGDVAAREAIEQLCLGRRRADEDDSRRRAVGRGRRPLHQVVDRVQLEVADRFVGEAVVGAGFGEELFGAEVHGERLAPPG